MTRTAGPATRKAPVRTAAQIVGVAFLIVGVLGFIPGITTNYDTLMFAGHDSDAKLLGVFQVSVLENLLHLAYGVAGLALSRTVSAARLYFVAGGALYLVIWLYGLVVDKDSAANFIPTNAADDWLHLVLGIGMIAIGLALTRGPEDRRMAG
jgi:arginine exporter protein ArgO